VATNRLRRIPDGMSFETRGGVRLPGSPRSMGCASAAICRARPCLSTVLPAAWGISPLQIAKAHGATVTAVCSEPNAGQARSLGADVVIDYRKQDFTSGSVRYDGRLRCPRPPEVRRGRACAQSRRAMVTTLPNPALIARSVWQRMLGSREIKFGNHARPS